MLPAAHISHRTTGRLRVKIPSRKGDQAYLLSVKEHFSGLEGVEAVEINPLTASVLITHSSDERAIAQYARSSNLFVLQGLDSSPAGLQRRISKAFGNINSQLKTATSGEIDVGGLAFVVLMGFGVYQISVGNLTALPWYAAFWYALNIFLKSGTETTAQA
jgi:hypothetical protein